MVSVSSIDKLCRNSYSFACFTNTALENSCHSQPGTYHTYIFIFTLKRKGGGARSYLQAFHTRECIENFFRNTVTEIFILHICTQICKWQYSNAFFGHCFCIYLFRCGNDKPFIGYSIYFDQALYVFKIVLTQQIGFYFTLIFYFIIYFVRDEHCTGNGK